MGPRARIVNGWCVAATIAIGQCMAMLSSFNLSCMGGQRSLGGWAKMVLDFFSMKNIYCENLSEKRIKARRGTTGIYHIYWMMFWRKAIPKFLANQTPKSQQGPLLFNSLFVEAPGNFCYQIMVPAQWAPTGYKWG